ncbi:ATP-dependent DNA helicase, RecQ family [Fulvivirga imtechensis AK7]|uniref:ATP-dependent DNA helicase RecQ n=1 Tax=Fulvivirga imtechensis AK7 TaxID=1237149 RepID=L8JXH4_9BACT|nr:ATP-dependent DNA helicase RecQ [Fulvivirga imtechensis]ELR72324.1 ATP-dependent DNA helicase, RecQ family [Fulvivirga imtechensis AK7]
MKQTLSILNRYWGYTAFRPVQEEIIDAVLAGEDVLALLPTGGGKSICFQVPAMAREGICIVVTPLIALMKDQVEQLTKRGIKAEAVFSGMSKKEIDIKLDNCIYGGVKFLYVSPERLQTDIFLERLKKMQVALLAVDEAHCISQWGYDFRPSYLRISDVRELIPDVNVVALTATATPEVRDDIQDKLLFVKKNVFQKSFARDNLSYAVRKVEGKEKKLLEIVRNVPGSAIIYTRTRKSTKEIAALLLKNGFSADFYHAGLPHEDRVAKQENWIRNKRRIMVATNAFGMGIDKPDVRLVVHMDLPQDLESYYQEAGRAGRDERKAFAVVIYESVDIDDLRNRVQQQYPSINYMKKVYQCMANYYKMAVGSGMGQSFDFEIQDFSDNYKLDHIEVYYALKKLEEEELIQFNESFYNPSQLHMAVDNKALYEFQIANAKFDYFIKMLLRVYGGELFNNFVKVSEAQLAKMLETTETEIVKALEKLGEYGIVNYDRKKEKPQVVFTVPRQDANNLALNKVRLAQRESNAKQKMEAIIAYVTHEKACRTRLILDYFGETSYDSCGICDVCVSLKHNKKDHDIDQYHLQARHLLGEQPLTMEELMDNINPKNRDAFLEVMREMVDAGEVSYDDQWRLVLVISQ